MQTIYQFIIRKLIIINILYRIYGLIGHLILRTTDEMEGGVYSLLWKSMGSMVCLEATGGRAVAVMVAFGKTVSSNGGGINWDPCTSRRHPGGRIILLYTRTVLPVGIIRQYIGRGHSYGQGGLGIVYYSQRDDSRLVLRRLARDSRLLAQVPRFSGPDIN